MTYVTDFALNICQIFVHRCHLAVNAIIYEHPIPTNYYYYNPVTSRSCPARLKDFAPLFTHFHANQIFNQPVNDPIERVIMTNSANNKETQMNLNKGMTAHVSLEKKGYLLAFAEPQQDLAVASLSKEMVFCVEIGDDQVPFIQLGQHQLRLDLEELDEQYQKRATAELRETPENVQNGLDRLRKLVQDEPGLYLPTDDDTFLIKFLRPFRFNAETAFKMLKKFYKFKLKYPKYGMNITPNSITHVFDNEVFTFLPARTPTGSRIMLINAGAKWNPKTVPLSDMFRAVMASIEIGMMEPRTQVGGVQVVINMDGFSLAHVYQFSPFLAKLIADWVQECAPVRLMGIHVINQSTFFDMVFAIFKPFLGEKLKKRLYFHSSNKKTIFDHIPKECLPERLGGDGTVPEFPGRLFSEMLYFYQDKFELYNTYGYSREKSSS